MPEDDDLEEVTLAVSHLADEGETTVVLTYLGEDLHLSPLDARKFAADILNAADTAEGKTALVFMPACSAPCCAPTPRLAP